MWRVTAVLWVIAGCSLQPRQGPGQQPQPRAAPEPVAATRLDGLVVWNAPLETAPAAVRERLALTALIIERFGSAPRPPVDLAVDRAAWLRAIDEGKGHFSALEVAIQGWVGSTRDFDAVAAVLPAAEARLHGTLVRLLEERARTRYLARIGIGRPAFGSCTHSPDEELGDALHDTEELADSCVEQSVGVTSALGSNRAECQRIAAWAQQLAATGVHGVCEPPEPGR